MTARTPPPQGELSSPAEETPVSRRSRLPGARPSSGALPPAEDVTPPATATGGARGHRCLPRAAGPTYSEPQADRCGGGEPPPARRRRGGPSARPPAPRGWRRGSRPGDEPGGGEAAGLPACRPRRAEGPRRRPRQAAGCPPEPATADAAGTALPPRGPHTSAAAALRDRPAGPARPGGCSSHLTTGGRAGGESRWPARRCVPRGCRRRGPGGGCPLLWPGWRQEASSPRDGGVSTVAQLPWDRRPLPPEVTAGRAGKGGAGRGAILSAAPGPAPVVRHLERDATAGRCGRRARPRACPRPRAPPGVCPWAQAPRTGRGYVGEVLGM